MVDANTYLINLSKALELTKPEQEKINASIENITKKIWSTFQKQLIDVIVFGSYDKDTMLPGSIDKTADVDIMIIFKENQFQPQTYLNQIRSLGDKTYPRSDVYPDHPTIVVELSHVKFELIPAYVETSVWRPDKIKIPASPGKEIKWIDTDPVGAKANLERKNLEKNGQTIPIIKIFKYWNCLNGYPFKSYILEKIAVDENVSGKNLLECFYDYINEFSSYEFSESGQKAFNDLKERKRRLKQLIDHGIPEYVELELSAFLPMP